MSSPYFYGGWYGFGVGFGFGYPYYPGYGYGYYGFPGPYPYYYDISGSLRLQVSPRETEVFIDGYYAGTVDNFDGVFQRLNVEPGEHDLELYLPGHRNLVQKLYRSPEKHRTSAMRCSRSQTARLRLSGLRAGSPRHNLIPARVEARPGPGQDLDPAILVTWFRASGLLTQQGDRAMPSTAASHCACSRETPVCISTENGGKASRAPSGSSCNSRPGGTSSRLKVTASGST